MFRILNLYKEAFSNIQPTIWMLSVVTFINRSGSMVLLFTSLYLTNELHFEIAEAGVCMSFYGAGSILGAYTGGWLTDRKNTTSIMIFSLFSSGFSLLFILIARTPFSIATVIFLYSFTSDIFRPAISKATVAYSTPENRTRSVSLTRLAVNLGFSVGPALGGVLAMYAGYKWLYVIDAGTSVGAAALLFFYLPKQQKQDVTKEKIVITKQSSAYRDKIYLFFILMVACFGTCFFQLFASVPQYFDKQCHYNTGVIGALMGLNGFLVVLIEMPLITSLEKKQKNVFRYIVTGALCIPVSFLILRLGGGIMGWSVLFIFIITFSEIFCMPFMVNYTMSKPIHERQGQYAALYSISYGLANIIAPLIGLGIADKYGFEMMFYFFIAMGLIVAVGFLWLNKKTSERLV